MSTPVFEGLVTDSRTQGLERALRGRVPGIRIFIDQDLDRFVFDARDGRYRVDTERLHETSYKEVADGVAGYFVRLDAEKLRTCGWCGFPLPSEAKVLVAHMADGIYTRRYCGTEHLAEAATVLGYPWKAVVRAAAIEDTVVLGVEG